MEEEQYDAIDALTDVGDDETDDQPENPEEEAPAAEDADETEDKGQSEDEEYKTYDNLDEANAKIRAQQFGVLNLQAEMAQKEREYAQTKTFMDALSSAESPQDALKAVAEVIARSSGLSVDDLLSSPQSKQKSDYKAPDFAKDCESEADAELARIAHEASVSYVDKALGELEARIMAKIGRYEPHLEGFVKESQTKQQVEKIRSETEPVAKLLVGEYRLKPESVAAWGGFVPTLEQVMEAASKHSYLLERANTVDEKKKALANAVMFEFKDTHIKDAILGKKPAAKKGPGGPNGKSDTRMQAHDNSAAARVGRRASELSKRIIAGYVD